MQNNVKHSLISLISAVLVFILLFGIFLLSGSGSAAIGVKEVAASDISFSKENGTTYIGSSFTVSDYTAEVGRGEKAKITVSAESGTLLDISVYYASGKSESRAFDPKTAESGFTSWEWTVPKNSTANVIRVVIRSADTYATFSINVI